jgi:molybdate transport system substrate-binding protein
MRLFTSNGADREELVFRRTMASCCAAAALLIAVSCGSETHDSGTEINASTEISGQVVVFTAASLTDGFDTMATAFEAEFPGAEVQLNLAGSSTLREQILGGAPAGVFASADERNMEVVGSAGELGSTPAIFARNSLQIAVPASNPGGVASLADLADPDLFVGICAEGVPCGDFARMVLDAAGVDASIDTNEGDVRALLTKIEADELDAGIVYATDVASSAGVAGIKIPREVNVEVRYPIATLAAAPNPGVAEAFVAFVLSPEGQDIIVAGGFGSA